MNMKSSLAIASTPQHILYIIEFMMVNNIKEMDLVVMIKRYTDKPQICHMLKECQWKSVRWIKCDSRLANKFISVFELFDSIFNPSNTAYQYGLYADYGSTIIANTQCDEVVWLGDGTKLLYEISPEYKGKLNRNKMLNFFDRFIKKVLRKSLTHGREVSVFTPFDISQERYTKNQFSWLKKKYEEMAKAGSTDEGNKVYFFGAYFCESDGRAIIKTETYLNIMTAIRDYYKSNGIEIIYVPHRHESQEKLDRMEVSLGLTINRFDFPAEYQFVINNTLPSNVASFNSTCLFHFHYIGFSEKITSFYIDFEDYSSPQSDRMRIYYNHLQSLIGEENVISVDSLGAAS